MSSAARTADSFSAAKTSSVRSAGNSSSASRVNASSIALAPPPGDARPPARGVPRIRPSFGKVSLRGPRRASRPRGPSHPAGPRDRRSCSGSRGSSPSSRGSPRRCPARPRRPSRGAGATRAAARACPCSTKSSSRASPVASMPAVRRSVVLSRAGEGRPCRIDAAAGLGAEPACQAPSPPRERCIASLYCSIWTPLSTIWRRALSPRPAARPSPVSASRMIPSMKPSRPKTGGAVRETRRAARPAQATASERIVPVRQRLVPAVLVDRRHRRPVHRRFRAAADMQRRACPGGLRRWRGSAPGPSTGKYSCSPYPSTTPLTLTLPPPPITSTFGPLLAGALLRCTRPRGSRARMRRARPSRDEPCIAPASRYHGACSPSPAACRAAPATGTSTLTNELPAGAPPIADRDFAHAHSLAQQVEREHLCVVVVVDDFRDLQRAWRERAIAAVWPSQIQRPQQSGEQQR